MSGPAPKKFEWTAGPLGPVKLAREEASDQAEISAGEETSFRCEAYQDRPDRCQTGRGAHGGRVPGRMPLRKIKIDQVDCRNSGVQEGNVVVVHPRTRLGSEIPNPQLARLLPNQIHNIRCLFLGIGFPLELQVPFPDQVEHEDEERPLVPTPLHVTGRSAKETSRVLLGSEVLPTDEREVDADRGAGLLEHPSNLEEH